MMVSPFLIKLYNNGRQFYDYGRLIFQLMSKPHEISPDLCLADLSQLTPKVINRLTLNNGKRIYTVLVDADNTLFGHRGKKIDDRLVGALETLTENYNVKVLSNTDDDRRKELEQITGLEVIYNVLRKPHPDVFEGIENAVMVDDRWLTGVAGAARLKKSKNVYAVKVSPLFPETDKLDVKIERKIENFLIRFYVFVSGINIR